MAEQDVDQLGQLVDRRPPQERPDRGDPRVMAELEEQAVGVIGVLEISPAMLVERGLIRSLEVPIKVLGTGKLTDAVQISAHSFSASAKEQIEAAGGTATVIERTDTYQTAKPRTRRLDLNRNLKKARFGKVGGPTRREDVEGGVPPLIPRKPSKKAETGS